MNTVKLCKYFPSFEEGKNSKDWKALKEDYLGKKNSWRTKYSKRGIRSSSSKSF